MWNVALRRRSMKLYQIPSRIWMEQGSFSRVASEARHLSASKAMVFAGPNIKKAGYVSAIEEGLGGAGISSEVFTDIEPEPSDRTALEAARLARETGADLIIGIGGGSNMDVAKAASILATNELTLEELHGQPQFKQPGINKILIPTTAGTGSEVTRFSLFANHEDGTKINLYSDMLLPQVVILDPELTRTAPPVVTAYSGMDALVHAIEAFTSNLATPMTDMFAAQAMKLIISNIRRAFRDGDDMEARAAMLEGSFLAGLAFGHAGVTAVHAFSHPLGVTYDIPHGTANTIMLPCVMEFNQEANPARFALVAEHLGMDTTGLDDTGAALRMVEVLRELISDIDLPTDLGSYNAQESDIPKVAAAVIADQGIMFCNPRKMDQEDAEAILRSVL
jgi:alcohol dehydrogenase